MQQKKELIALCPHDVCTGCFACESVCPKQAIKKVADDEGFYYPQINSEKCIGCHACQKMCPVTKPISKYDDGKVYAAWINDIGIRKSSSSGGLFSALAIWILRNNGAVVGAAMHEDNYLKHVLIESEEQLFKLRGSKYVQSMLCANLYAEMRRILKEGRNILFCGTPCQVAAMKSVFKVYERQLFTIDLVCHGVPSPDFFASYLSKLKEKIPNLLTYNFRDMENWLECTNVNVNVCVNGITVKKMLYGLFTFYQDAFMKGYLHRKNCYQCKFCSTRRIGDITLADFWGIGKRIPISGNLQNGCSMVSVNSLKGKTLFESIKSSITIYPRTIQEAIDGGNEQLVRPSFYPKGRESFYVDAKNLSYNQLIKKYELKIRKNPTQLKYRFRNMIKVILKKVGL